MSTVSRRPRVKSISSAVLEAAAISCVEAVGTLISNAIRTMDAASRDAWTQSTQTLPARNVPKILPVSSIKAQIPVVAEGIRQELTQHKLAPVESVKLTALMTLQAAPFACEAAILNAPVEALVQASTEAEAVKASKRLMDVLQKGHQQVMARALVTACRNASVQSGFTCIETTPGLDGSIRVIASDSAARALVTEIRADQEWEPSIVTEVVGVTDGSCVGILDQFDRALEEQGVRAGTSDRKWTGGVCELGAAKELLKKIKPGAKAKQEDKRRTRKLNQTPKIHIR
jgi:hypothetical protein